MADSDTTLADQQARTACAACAADRADVGTFDHGIAHTLTGDCARPIVDACGRTGNHTFHGVADPDEPEPYAVDSGLEHDTPGTGLVPFPDVVEERLPVRSGSEALLVYAEGDCDTVTVLTLDHAHATVRLPDGTVVATVIEDLGLGVDDDLTFVLDDGCTTLAHNPVEARPAPVPPKAVGSGRRHDVPGCPRCDAADTVFHPAHDASRRCDSGGYEHCSCDVCF